MRNPSELLSPLCALACEPLFCSARVNERACGHGVRQVEAGERGTGKALKLNGTLDWF